MVIVINQIEVQLTVLCNCMMISAN